MKRILAVVISIVLASWFAPHYSASAQKEGPVVRVHSLHRSPPPAGPARPFALPAPREVRLANGLAVLMIEDHRTPMVTIVAGIRVGSADDPSGRPGLAEATADLLTEGAGTRSAQELAREIETMGGSINGSASDDFTELEATVVSENAERMLEIASDVLLRPSFPESEVALYKSNRIQHLTVQRQEPAFLVSEHFNRIVFGPHPYAVSSPTPESVAALDRREVASFYSSNFTPARAVLVIVGDFTSATMEARTKSLFSAWRADAALSIKFPEMPERTGKRIYLMDRPGSEQADFRIGNLAVARSDPDYYPLLVASTILGGGTSSRLFLSIRERKGYAYDVSSSVSAPRQRGTFFGASETRTEVTLPAIREMLAEFERMRDLKVTARDLRNAKNYLNGVFSLTLSTQGGIAGRILQSRLLDLPDDYLQSYRARIDQVTADQVQQAARKYILTDRPAIVVVGDAAKLKSQLETLGPVDVVDIEGKPPKPPAKN
jgi:zinc protease